MGEREDQMVRHMKEHCGAFPYRYRVMLVDDEEEVREGVREKSTGKAVDLNW